MPPEAGAHAQLVLAAPRFEDSFIDILGGGPGGRSLLAESMRTIEVTREPVVVARGLTKRFGDFTAAADISFEVGGEIFGLLGPNGAGKSTTFRMLCGLLSPPLARALLQVSTSAAIRRGARPPLIHGAEVSLYGDLSVAQNLSFFAGVCGLRGARKHEQVKRRFTCSRRSNFRRFKPRGRYPAWTASFSLDFETRVA